MSIGQKIKALRESKQMKQEELAEMLGISQSMVCQLERGTKAMTMPLGQEIAQIFSCTLDDLVN